MPFTYGLVVLGRLNQAPYFTTAPPLEAAAGRPYAYPFAAADPDGDALTYALLSGPAGMTLNGPAQALEFQPAADQLGTHDVALRVSDGRGGTAEQQFMVTVTPPVSNRPPVFVSVPVTQVRLGLHSEAGPELITNGGFEIGPGQGSILLTAGDLSIGGWKVIGIDVHYVRETYWHGHESPASVDLDGGSNGGVEQVIATTPGQTYLLSFRLAGNLYDAPPVKTVHIEAAGQVTNVTYDGTGQDRNAPRWDLHTWMFRAEAETTTLRFLSTTTPSSFGPALDDVSVTRVSSTEQSGSYWYGARAKDEDEDALRYSVSQGPDGFEIVALSGDILWRPTDSQLGEHDVVIRVEDGRGGVATQAYRVCVLPGDQPPVVTRQPVDLAIGQVDAGAVTADGQSLLAGGTVSARVTNHGPGPTTRPFDVRFFEDRDLDGVFGAAADVVLGTATVNEPLPPAASLVVTAAVSGPVLFPGNVVWAMVDARQEIAETDEANNVSNSGLECIAEPQVGQFNPVIKWAKSSFGVLPGYNQVMMAPAVIDVNGDRIPDVVFSTFAGGRYQSDGVLRAISGDGGSEIWSVTDAQHRVQPGSDIAVGDIDSDGRPEILTVHTSGALIAFEHDGAFKWMRSGLWGEISYGGPAIADLDHDGLPEIVIGGSVVNSDGTIRWQGNAVGGQGRGGAGPHSLVADIDLDGSPEVVAGKSVYRADGALYWNSTIPDGFPAVGNFDDDLEAEIVLVASGNVYLLEHTGAVKWGPVAIPGGGHGGPPTVADMDGDGVPEIGVAGGSRYVAFKADGSVYWQRNTRDLSSSVTGSSVFDFEGDGRAEVIYADELFLRVYNGTNGATLYELAKGSGTLYELPLIVDVDADGNAEIVAVANNYAFGNRTGILVIGDLNDTWVSTRKVWNQHTYHINNVNDDGTIPRHEEPSWLTHNTYRLNALPTRDAALAAPDLIAARLRVSGAVGDLTATVRVGNGGAAPAPPGVQVAFYAGDPRGTGTLLGVGATAARLVPGAFEDVTVTLTNPAGGELWVVADDDGTGTGRVRECQEENNFHSAGLALPLANQPPRILSAPLTEAREGLAYRYQAEADDADGPDALRWSLPVAPDGMSIHPTGGLLSWTPGTAQAGHHPVLLAVTDPAGAQDFQEFIVHVTDQFNAPPVFVSTPPGDALPNRTLQYHPLARDPEGDALAFDLVASPAGMLVETNTGVVAWRPLFSQLGTHDVILRAQDGRGGVALQSWQITVTAPNSPPVFTSHPPGTAVAGLPWRYHVRAQDAEGQPLAFSLGTNAPAGLVLVPATPPDQTARLEWTPDAGQLGAHPVEILVRDAAGGEARQAFDLTVLLAAANTAPAFTTAPRTRLRVGTPWAWLAGAADPDGDPLAFALSAAPAGLELADPAAGLPDGVAPRAGEAALLRWTPGALGTFPVSLVVRDGRGGAAVQEFTLEVASTLANEAPVIVSVPPAAATAGQALLYDAVAEDADGDGVRWRLVAGPAGMSLDAATGALRWVPTLDQLGTNTVVIEAVDDLLAASQQAFAVEVGCVNRPPQIVSVPPVLAHAGRPYLYAPRATDADGDRITWSLAAPVPPGLTLDPITGLVRWTPGTNQVGGHVVQVRAGDGRGGTDTQLYTVNVVDDRANRNPVIVSSPPRGVTAGRPYAYLVRATDPDGDALTFLPVRLPAGATLTPQPGSPHEALVAWTPDASQLGPNDFTLAVRDTAGGSGSQRFSVTVRANLPPVITGVPPATAPPDLAWRHDVVASDPEGDALAYALLTAPAGLTMDGLGRMAWTPARDQLGTHPVALRVTDAFGLSATQDFTVTVAADTEPPQVALEVVWNLVDDAGRPYVRAGTTTGLRVRATDNVGVAARELRVAGVPVALGADFTAQVAFPASGVVEAVAVATDAAGNTATATQAITVVDPDAQGGISIVIHSPANDAEVFRPADLVGTVVSSNAPLREVIVEFAELTPEASSSLDVAHPGLDYQPLRRFSPPPGTYALSNAVLGRFDPTLLQNGPYLVRVTAYDINGQGRQEGVLVQVAGRLKFGEFRLEFTDLQVPVAGVPITITRVYDSRDARRVGDFGHGWSLGLMDARLRESAKRPFTGLGGEESTFTTRTRVFLNLPDGRRAGFRFTPEVGAVSPIFGAFFRPAYTAEPGVYDRLEPLDPAAAWQIRGDGTVYGGFGLVGYDPAGYRLVARDGTAYVYDERAGLQSVTDRNGNRLAITRDGIFHYLAGSATPGVQVPFLRDARGRIERILDPAGNALRYTYDAAGDLRAFTDQVTNVTRYAYSAARAHFLTNIIDPFGRDALRMEYDADGRLATLRDALGNPIEQRFDVDSNTVTFRDANGHTNVVRYDDRGNEVLKVVSGISTNRFAYDHHDNLTNAVNGRGFATNFVYDARGNLTRLTDALSNVTHIAYNDLGKPLAVTNALGQTLRLRYDPAGLLTEVVNHLGHRTLVGRDAQGRVTNLVDAAGHATAFRYEDGCPCGQPGLVINPDGSFRRYEYDALGRTVMEVTELGAETRTEYDAAGRLLWTRDALTNFTYHHYDGPRVTNIVDALGRGTRYVYDEFGRTNLIITAEGGTNEFRYDANGNRTHVIDAVGNVTRFVYDAANRVTNVVDTFGRTNHFAYDGEGNRLEAVDRNDRRRTFAYDALNRMTNEVWWEGAGVVKSIVFRFNELGVQTRAMDDVARYDYRYDDLNRLERVLAQSAGVPDFTLLYTYTPLGQVESVTDHWGVRVSSGYDNRNRLAQRTWSGGPAGEARVDFHYAADGSRTSLERFADLAGSSRIGFTTNAYNRAGIVTNITHVGSTGSVLAKYDYGFDAAWQITQWSINNQPSTFNYDATGQLTNALNTAQPDESFRYDLNGNRVGAQSSGQYLVGGNNQVLSDGTNSYAYDAEGNMASRSNSVTGVLTTYQWDHRNRLTSVLDYDPAGVVTQTVAFQYDAMNRRLAKVVNGQTNRYVYNGDDSWADLDAAGGVTARYLHGARIDELLARWRAGDGRGWYLTDHLGTVRGIADAAGAAVAQVDYSSFGQVLAVSNSAAVDRFLFTGRELDGETGLYFYRARYYSAQLGRFPNQDPIGFNAGDNNLHRYVGNSPLGASDPHGYGPFLEKVIVHGIIGAVVGGLSARLNGTDPGQGAAGGLVTGLLVGLFAPAIALDAAGLLTAGANAGLSVAQNGIRCSITGQLTRDQAIRLVDGFLSSIDLIGARGTSFYWRLVNAVAKFIDPC